MLKGGHKRDLSVLTDKIKSFIQSWLNIGDYTQCPFENFRGELDCSTICSALFPLLRNRKYKHICPCHAYPTKYVVRMAKEFVK